MSFVLLFKVPTLFKSTEWGWWRHGEEQDHGNRPRSEERKPARANDRAEQDSGVGVFSGSSKDTCDELAVTYYYLQAQDLASQRTTGPLEASAEK